jgi:hypothetical protein
LDRFTIDRLVRILKRLDQRIHLRIEIRRFPTKTLPNPVGWISVAHPP